MIKKKVTTQGVVLLKDGDSTVASIGAELCNDRSLLKVTLSGVLRTDVQPYLSIELQFYSEMDVPRVEVDCSKLTAVSPGCFGELLDLKIKQSEKSTIVSFTNKPECVCIMEKKMGKKL